MDPIDRLVALEEIGRLKAKYFRYVDTKNWDGLRSEIFTADFHGDYTAAGGGVYENAEDTLTMLDSALSTAVTAHMGSNPEIDLTDPENATGIWAMHDRLEYPNGVLSGSGHYHETYRRTDDGWRIAAATLTRLYQRFDPTP